MIPNRAAGRWPRRIAGASGLLVAGLGLFALLGWILNVPAWPSLWSETIPMAPSTALLFLVLGTSVCLRAWVPQADASLRWAVAVGVLATLISLALAVTSSMGIYLKGELLGIRILSAPGEQPLGHMSPMTAILFVAGGLSFLTSLHWPVARRGVAGGAWWLACLLIVGGLILILTYFFGVEQLYSGPIVPPAALTSASFLILGIALLALADLRSRSVAPSSERTEISFGLLLLIFSLLAVGVITIGTLSYRTYAAHYRDEARAAAHSGLAAERGRAGGLEEGTDRGCAGACMGTAPSRAWWSGFWRYPRMRSHAGNLRSGWAATPSPTNTIVYSYSTHAASSAWRCRGRE